MKIEARRVAAFLAAPGPCRLVLLHGEDGSLVRRHAETVTRAVAGSLDDPFRVAVLERAEHGRLAEEAGALSLTGGRRVVRLREAGEAVLPGLKQALAAGGDTLLVVEAPGLARGRLRSFAEALPEAGVVACYPDEGRGLEAVIREQLRLRDVAAGPGVVEWLAGQLGADRASTEAEIEKLALHAEPGCPVTLEEAQACVGDATLLQLDEALFAATAGDLAALDRTLERALGGGLEVIAVLRSALSHLQRLHLARLLVAEGMPAEAAVRTLRPPVFFRRTPDMVRALALWSPAALQRAIEEVRAVEQACKRTGARDLALCRRFLSVLARQAAQARRR